jgi:hypothetical protein
LNFFFLSYTTSHLETISSSRETFRELM